MNKSKLKTLKTRYQRAIIKRDFDLADEIEIQIKEIENGDKAIEIEKDLTDSTEKTLKSEEESILFFLIKVLFINLMLRFGFNAASK
jgi:hypothetical protein